MYLCLDHHDYYDSKTSQSKGLTANEVKAYRDDLYNLFANIRKNKQGYRQHNKEITEVQIKQIQVNKRPTPNFNDLLYLADKLGLSSLRDKEYEKLIELALAHNEPDLAIEIVRRLSLSNARDQGYWKIFHFYLSSNQTEKAKALPPTFSLSSDRDRAIRLLIEFGIKII